ncbi:MAG: acyltransferase, partial [Bdellovibrionaceae bacterium]|nr:acyltransferase [Pseudobdellovibrionaceae bacterium]
MLRAAAIVLALFFHAGFSFASRGYVSLDIFFVISGYVITNQIAEEIENRKFSLVRFYERRMRRLLPALFVVLIFTLIVGCILLPPYEMSRLALSTTSVTLFFSNFFFQNEGWYFDTAAYLKPLLHLWSLSLEEQFYFLFPLLFMFSARWGKKTCVSLLALVAAISLGFYLADFFQFTRVSFYQLPWRAWELLLGALVSLLWTRINSVGLLRSWRRWLYWLGLTLIFLSVFLFHPATDRFLNLYWTRIFTAIGTVMMILFMPAYTGHLNWVKKILVQLGLISYGTYLWHQPLFAFSRVYIFGKSRPEFFLLMIGISFVMGYLSWRFIEMPVRSSQKL